MLKNLSQTSGDENYDIYNGKYFEWNQWHIITEEQISEFEDSVKNYWNLNPERKKLKMKTDSVS